MPENIHCHGDPSATEGVCWQEMPEGERKGTHLKVGREGTGAGRQVLASAGERVRAGGE